MIRTFKDNLKAVLATLDIDFPIAHQVLLITQAIVTLNMLQDSLLNKKILAYTYTFCNYDFNTTPIAPTGTKLVVHSKPDQRLTWDFNGESGCYIGTSMEHYRCVKCCYPQTNQVCN